MGLSRLNEGEQWFDYFPVQAKMGDTDPSRTLLVDVGGGIGHDLIAFKKKFPDLPGRLIVQDLAVVVEAAKDLPAGIEAMGHDFFTPQPIRGAKTYYLRTVLHDWPDKQAREILVPIREAMSQDSILLINENVLSETEVSLYAAQLDLMMMAMFSSLDRTVDQFKALLDSVGLEVFRVWRSEAVTKGSGTLLECGLKRVTLR